MSKLQVILEELRKINTLPVFSLALEEPQVFSMVKEEYDIIDIIGMLNNPTAELEQQIISDFKSLEEIKKYIIIELTEFAVKVEENENSDSSKIKYWLTKFKENL
jgi:hypothetical protein